jgi:hypothetical protein
MPDSNPHLSERAKKAEKIIAHPQNFKICEGCDSIVAERVVTCPNCHGYRFDSDPKAIIEHAKLLGSREQTGVSAQDLL